MRVLFDQGTPAPLRFFLTGHEVITAHELGWSDLKNGELLSAAEANFDVFITTDQNLRYQQNLSGRNLAILVLPTTSWPKLQGVTEIILSVLNKIQPGEYRELPFESGR
jgi:predicted nuclease of predicted toxin-antitoxin system